MAGNGALNSWKEISAYLNRSIRTVQRWEEELGLPIHRVPGKRRDIVFAFPSELDQWQRGAGAQAVAHSTENGNGTELSPAAAPEDVAPHGTAGALLSGTSDPRAYGKRYRLLLFVLAPLVVAGIAAAVYFAGGFSRQPRHPVRVVFETQRAIAFDAAGLKLWTWNFPGPVHQVKEQEARPPQKPRNYLIADLDGDGSNEVLLFPNAVDSQRDPLLCLNADGSQRFAYWPGRKMTFGAAEFSEVYTVFDVLITANPAAGKSIWVTSRHFPYFPSVLAKLDAQGNLQAEFWHSGHIQLIREIEYRGRRGILGGAAYNEDKQASIFVVDYDNPSGTAPVTKDYYQCKSCPSGAPLAMLVFPRTELARVLDDRANVRSLHPTPSGWEVGVTQGFFPGSPPFFQYAPVQYTLDRNLSVIRGEYGDGYGRYHADLETQKRIHHAFRPAEASELFPVKRWNGKAFELIAGPQKIPETELAQKTRNGRAASQ